MGSWNRLFYILLFFPFLAFSAPSEKVIVSTGSDVLPLLQEKFTLNMLPNFNDTDDSIFFEIDENDLLKLSHFMHHNFHRCGGYFVHDEESLLKERTSLQKDFFLEPSPTFYNIDQEKVITPLLQEVNEFSIRNTILKLSSFHNRYYKSNTGVDSMKWIKSEWESLLQGRSDSHVELYQHRNWPQPTVIATIEGTTRADEIIVIGGHGDSISGFFPTHSRAPGADDNASGIATITEVIRILGKAGYRPERTIKFMAYAAEEVGLRGSNEIAQDFREQNKNVVGVLQLDMTNHSGPDWDIAVISDYTHDKQNKFVGELIDQYIQLPWGVDRCGYACSDHASWNAAGYPASTPFESKKKYMNRNIHTSRDTIEVSGGNANHALKFAKLALAYTIELDR